jgi:hypothetical protein
MGITEYFYKLTKENWGFPWHIILAFLGMRIGLRLIWFDMPYLWNCIFLWFLINAIGYVYELIQGKQKDTRQDLIANNIGLFFGMI